ncbi:sensor histidine kinase [Nocardioides mesophilus]|uniref:histidine kinase n=1 Tax=Nocardioides mesophilus TaxID=433659 RepID=A0A7G9RG32_9ACTN|nr:HAMP domain-containing sensor histidine kinase [Nocardioides mesophilus]QNN54557.1 HAMP domain-containing histidine kinase [Nocardioides mesophilus]
MRRLLPSSLTSRLVLTAVLLVTVVSLLIAVATTVAIRSYLLDRLDTEVQLTSARALRDGPAPATDPDGDHEGSGDTDVHGLPDVEPGRGQETGTVAAYLTTGAALGQVITEDGDLAPLSRAALAALRAVPADGAPHGVDLRGLGDYRVAVTDNGSFDVAAGLPTRDVDATIRKLVSGEVLFILAGILAAGGIALVVVRRQMRPLHQVARTAHEVAQLPLATGEIGMTARVPEPLTDERTEIGQVGSALNTLLGHVERSLDERHRSEQQVRQFVADASHELRTPLATINGYAQLSRRSAEPDAAQLRQAMAKVEVEAARMSALVEDLLLLARLDAGRPLERADVDLTKMVLESVGDSRVMAPDHRWALDLPDEPVVVVGDEQRLHQVLANLLANARRHTPAGTTVTVGAHLAADRATAVLSVLDDGPGLPADLRDSVFERFTRGDSARTRASGGAGLGLSLAKAITEAHGGRITVSSRPGHTAFTVSLPVRPPIHR